MISMPKIQSMRQLRGDGESIAAISRELEVSEPTVRKYLRKDDLSPRPPVGKSRPSMVDRRVPVIEQWLAEDRETWHKQRHTATRIWQRLRDEHGATVSYSTVRRKVAGLRREFAFERDAGFMDLVWHPGEAQADFGQVEVSWRGAPARMHHFVLDFPYSNIGISQLMPGENAECTCQALKDIFAWLGGVPERIVYDNAAGVGRKRHGGEVRLTELFERFQAHYGFGYAFCNPYSGHEKGAVETKVGAVRRSLFVPRPSIWNLAAFNGRLFERCLRLGGKPHYRKGEDETALFEADRAALMPPPAREFDVVRFERMKADEYGVAGIDGRHRYAADPANAGREVIVAFRALEVEIPDATGRRIALHPRAYGRTPTGGEDPSRRLEPPCDRPNAWADGRVRDVLPDPPREWLDARERGMLREGLHTLKHANRESGWGNAVAAMLQVLETSSAIDRAGVEPAAGLAAGQRGVTYDEPVDLSELSVVK